VTVVIADCCLGDVTFFFAIINYLLRYNFGLMTAEHKSAEPFHFTGFNFLVFNIFSVLATATEQHFTV